MGQKVTQPWFVSGDGNSLSQTLGVSGVRLAQCFSSSGWGDPWGKATLRDGLRLVFMLEGDEFLFCGFTSTSESDLLVPQMGRPSFCWEGSTSSCILCLLLPSLRLKQSGSRIGLLCQHRNWKFPSKVPIKAETTILEAQLDQLS